MDAKTVRILAEVGAGIALFSSGSIAGYFYAKKKLEAQYEQTLAEELVKAREEYKQQYKSEEFETPAAAAQALGVDMAAGQEVNRTPEEHAFDKAVAAMKSYAPESEMPPSDEITTFEGRPVSNYNGVVVEQATGEVLGVVKKNVFDNPDVTIDFAYQQEIAARTPDKPYIISQDEYVENDPGHEQVTITYYEGDNTLADHNDKQVAMVDMTIGWDNLRFGHRSGDDDIVFVRNEHYKMDMEIERDERRYAEVVAGFVNRQGLG